MDSFLPLRVSGKKKDDHISKRRPYLKAKDKMNKKGRIVVRNLAFQADKQKVLDHFKIFGDVKEVCILENSKGKKTGVAFVQYGNTLSALKAIKNCNRSPFMGRLIAVDMAIPKHVYASPSLKKENAYEDSVPEVKMEDIKEEISSVASDDIDVKGDFNDTKGSNVELDSDDESDCEDDDDEFESDDEREGDIKSESDDDFENCEAKIKKEDVKPEFVHKPVSNDVAEGKTLFLRNLSFEATEEQIQELLSQYGELKYVLFCRDKITKRFKGTAFAQFLTKDSASACLETFGDPVYKNQFRVGGRSFIVCRAVGRGDLTNTSENKLKKSETKDKRNIYLAREGVIREGTKPANGVSKSDLKLRMEREILKRKMLANLNVFVSPVRLFVCNLPLELGDKELKNIFKEHSDKAAVIKESKIMRNLYNLDDSGKAVSKGHGFVTFTSHAHALEALRNLNNNPNIFSVNKRPIIEFSMENKSIVMAKEKRKQRNSGHGKREKKSNSSAPDVPPTKTKNEKDFAGSKFDPTRKGLKSLHSHIGPKVRHKDDKSKTGGKKLSRNKVNNQLRNARGTKRKRNNLNPTKKKRSDGKLPKNMSYANKKKSGAKAGGKKNKRDGKSNKQNSSKSKPKTKKRKFI